MKFVFSSHTSGTAIADGLTEYNPPVNLDLCVSFDYSGDTGIVFVGSGHVVKWQYPDTETRNLDFDMLCWHAEKSEKEKR